MFGAEETVYKLSNYHYISSHRLTKIKITLLKLRKALCVYCAHVVGNAHSLKEGISTSCNLQDCALTINHNSS